MKQHTPEPWTFEDDYYQGSIGDCTIVKASDGGTVAVLPDECHPNAARIVACINGCAGINPEAVHHLLGACIDAQDRYGPNTPIGRRIRAAIAKAREVKP